jgi:hypothetical protein
MLDHLGVDVIYFSPVSLLCFASDYLLLCSVYVHRAACVVVVVVVVVAVIIIIIIIIIITVYA